MEHRTIRKATILQIILTGIVTALLAVCGLLWNQNTDLIKSVQAQCINLDDKKADKEMFKFLVERIDKRFDTLEKKIDDM